jgi:putative NADH-flavin reductase
MNYRICIFGASGATGMELTRQAVQRGLDVVAFVRSEATHKGFPQSTTIVTGSLTDQRDVEYAITNCDAVICAFGPRPGSSDVFCAEATQNIIEAMKTQAVGRLLCITGAMVGDYPHLSWFMRSLMSTYQKKQPDQARDRTEQERLVAASGLAWTLVKPPRLSEGAEHRHFRSGENLRVGMMSRISRSDLSSFILDQVDEQECLGKRVIVEY